MGSRLADFKNQRQVDDRALAEHLQCDETRLFELALCVAPTPGTQFANQVNEIASFVDCEPNRLVALLRESEAVRIAAKRVADSQPNYSLAARDKKRSNTSDGEVSGSTGDEDDGQR